MSDQDKELNEIIYMQVRLFRMACEKWNMSTVECADIFDKHKVDDYIHELYGLFHVQGDEANLYEIEEYLSARGETSWS